MQKPLQIAFRHMPHSKALEARIRKETERLETLSEQIISCHVVIATPHRHHQQGQLFEVRIDLQAPKRGLHVGHGQHDKQAHEDPYIAIRDAFDAMQRQLEDYVWRIKRKVKQHETPAHGLVIKLFPHADYGTIETPVGRQIYFHRNSVLHSAFDTLATGAKVRFVEEQGEKGPQASSVQLIGRHRLKQVI